MVVMRPRYGRVMAVSSAIALAAVALTVVARTAPPVASAPAHGARFVPVIPTRILDTRQGVGAPRAPVGDGEEIVLTVTGAMVPATATAVALNVTATNTTAAGYVTAWANGDARPNASNLNIEKPGQTIANLAVVKVGSGGAVVLFAYRQLDLIADVAGYWMPATESTSGRFVSVVPTRVLDTRSGIGAPAGPVGEGKTIDVQLLGEGGLPAAGISSVVVNLTVTNAQAPGFVTAWPTGTPPPLASNVNVERAGQTISNLATLPLGTGGRLSLFAYAPTDLVIDVLGYYTDDSAPSSDQGLFVVLGVPVRVLDTRPVAKNGGLFHDRLQSQRGDLEVNVPGHLPSPDAAAIVANVTATQSAGPGFVTVWPAATPRPNASNINIDRAGQTIPNLVVAGLNTAGRVSVYSYAQTDLLVDVAGYFTGPATPPAPGTPIDPEPPDITPPTVPAPTPPPSTPTPWSAWNADDEFALASHDTGTMSNVCFLAAPWGAQSWGIEASTFSDPVDRRLEAARFELSNDGPAHLSGMDSNRRWGFVRYVQGDVWGRSHCGAIPWRIPPPLRTSGHQLILKLDYRQDLATLLTPDNSWLMPAVNLWFSSPALPTGGDKTGHKPLVMDLAFDYWCNIPGCKLGSFEDADAFHYQRLIPYSQYGDPARCEEGSDLQCFTIPLEGIISDALAHDWKPSGLIDYSADSLSLYQLDVLIEFYNSSGAASIDNVRLEYRDDS